MTRRSAEAGYSLVALMAAVTIMLFMMSAAVPTWRYVVNDDREEELLFRGGQIVDAIQGFQKRNGNALPPSLDVLVKGKYLRKLYKDPMSKDGKWRLVHQGEAVIPVGGGVGGGPSPPATTQPPITQPPTTLPPGLVLGGIVGVASTSADKSIRVFNGRTRYDQWVFAVGQPRVVGRTPIVLPPGGGGGSPRPSSPPPR